MQSQCCIWSCYTSRVLQTARASNCAIFYSCQRHKINSLYGHNVRNLSFGYSLVGFAEHACHPAEGEACIVIKAVLSPQSTLLCIC